MFKEIGDLCGNWKLTEEKTELKNHLKWARIEIVGDDRNIPNKVVIERDGENFFIPIWDEGQTRFESGTTTTMEIVGEDKGLTPPKNQRAKLPYEIVRQQSSLIAVDWMGNDHVGGYGA